MDNGFASCADPAKLQEICDHFGPGHIQALFRRWTEALPQPFTADDREAGYAHHLSLLQAEFSLTQLFAQPRYGRAFFEQAIRDHLDLGRPDQVSLLFDRRVTKRTPGIFRTRVITDGVNPNIQATFKHSAVKQYFKEGRALRTETTTNDTYDIGVGRSLENLPKLIEFGRALTRCLLAASKPPPGACRTSRVSTKCSHQPSSKASACLPCVSAIPVPSPSRPPSAASPSAPSPRWAFAPPTSARCFPTCAAVLHIPPRRRPTISAASVSRA